MKQKAGLFLFLIGIVIGFVSAILIVNTFFMVDNANSVDICLETLDEMCEVTNNVINTTNMCLDTLGQSYNYSFYKLTYLDCGGKNG